ncbi:MAG TPA: ATP-grasp domain-containing protein [Acidimicrobiia bacterium]
MPRVLLLLPTSTYRARDFVAAARRLGLDVVIGSEEPQVLDVADRAVLVPLDDVDTAAAAVGALDRRSPLDAVVAVDDQGVVVASEVAARLGLPHNPTDAVAATRDKTRLRALLARAEVAQPDFRVVADADGARGAAEELGAPVVVKPVSLSASRGVIRVDDVGDVPAVAARVLGIQRGGPLLVERYVPGAEVALEGLLHDGALEVLAIFDKPDPMEGPYFEETIFVTPSRLDRVTQDEIVRVTAAATDALGLATGPVHAELRVPGDGRAVLLEVAARSIGGLCARSLVFGLGVSLEELILRQATGRALGSLQRAHAASGVMMLPIPRAGTLRAVHGRDAALAIEGIDGLEITIPVGHDVVPLPDGDRYLGFVFAHGETPGGVERTLRRAFAALDVVIEPHPS